MCANACVLFAYALSYDGSLRVVDRRRRRRCGRRRRMTSLYAPQNKSCTVRRSGGMTNRLARAVFADRATYGVAHI